MKFIPLFAIWTVIWDGATSDREDVGPVLTDSRNSSIQANVTNSSDPVLSAFRENFEQESKTNLPGTEDSYKDLIRLKNDLLKISRETKMVRPVRRISDIVYVTMHVGINYFLEMNEKEEYLKVNVILDMSFDNEFLGWDPKEYGNITQVEWKAVDEVWIPDMQLNDGVDLKNNNYYIPGIPIFSTKKNPKGEGWIARVKYSYIRDIKVRCSFDTFYFPFDHNNCTISYWPAAYTRDRVKIKLTSGAQTEIENDEWEIFNLNNDTVYYISLNHEIHHGLRVNFVLKRRPLYYIVNLLIPSIAIAQVSFFGFFSPSSSHGDRTEKVSLGMGTLMAMSVLLLTICDLTPINSKTVPLMGMFFLLIMLLIAIGIIVTTAIMKVEQRGKQGKRVPKWIRSTLFICVAPVLGFKVPKLIRKQKIEDNMLDGPEYSVQPDDSTETQLLQNLASVKQLSKDINDMVSERNRELAEIEHIFLAKILDTIMLILFTLLLNVVTIVVVMVGINQMPTKNFRADHFMELIEAGLEKFPDSYRFYYATEE